MRFSHPHDERPSAARLSKWWEMHNSRCMFANGGSQVVDERTGLLLVLEALLGIFAVAERVGFEVWFRWVRRCFI